MRRGRGRGPTGCWPPLPRGIDRRRRAAFYRGDVEFVIARNPDPNSIIMARSFRNPLLSRSFQRALGAMTRTAVRAGSKAMAQALQVTPVPARARRAKPLLSRPRPARPKAAPKLTDATTGWSRSMTVGAMGYRLYKPPGVLRSERLPILVMLHGCSQDAEALAVSSRMNQIAARERFLVLYPMQERFANLQGCST